MLNFTIGPVMSNDKVREIGSEQVPYFRTPEFSELMLESEELMKKLLNAPENSRCAFITGSGTASMEAVVMNVFTSDDKILIVNGGGFGERFVELCKLHEIPYESIDLEVNKDIAEDILKQYENKGFTGFLVNIHETSTGVHYNLDLISEFCRKNNLFLVVDAISSFLADEVDMSKNDIDVVITGSQKALACPPGVSIIALSPKAVERVEENTCKSMYLDLKNALKNGERGQTPFTPAVAILIQINARLNEIFDNGGVGSEIEKVAEIADNFRSQIKDLPFEITSESLSNAVTPLHPTTASAEDIFHILKDEYGIWICPNGGEFKDTLFRVGHIGDLTIEDNNRLIEALKDMQKRNLI
ncbi:MAG: aminotransferase class V-fold PLP-dependent enzyme [Methanobrevibacter sp.]|uniref:pyridoxal-phosphate-dependent aminotransferase family protein n=1 Tax=Methanobrevibacter sp. TaxID=66852 RepID=UPI0026E0B820|nr:aminotransferase class V-fold PLP-dependent enzyme [Methanobrevibacter sp.]MDO5848682.1 aminotransferase class V-fold PLP-dependent enzyme [Methanobrevibacter sp.]